MSRGVCPDALAVEVHALTLASVRRRYGARTFQQQTIPDAVGEAHMIWLAGPSDKTKYPARLHAHWVAKLAHTYLHGTSRQRGVRHVRPIASWDSLDANDRRRDDLEALRAVDGFETLLRETAGEPTPHDHEAAALGALDLARRICRGRATHSPGEALAALMDRGWSIPQIAVGVGKSEQAVSAWIAGTRNPSAACVAALIALVAADGPPPPPVTRHEARRLHAARGEGVSAEQVRDALASLLVTHSRGALATLLGITPQAVGAWVRGKTPSPEKAIALIAAARK